MNCNKCKDLLLSYLDDELNTMEIVEVEDHLSGCPGCREEMEALTETQGELRLAFQTMAAQDSPSPHAWENIRSQLEVKGKHKSSILSRVKSKLGGPIRIPGIPYPAWQMLGMAGVAALIMFAVIVPLFQPESTVKASMLATFSSYDELKEFLENNTKSAKDSYLESLTSSRATFSDSSGVSPEGNSMTDGGSDFLDYSTTEIQVAGIDEADIVKTDGEFIYLAVDSRVVVARAHPAGEAQIMSEITLDYEVSGIFINGDKLAIIYQNYDVSDGYYYGNMNIFVSNSLINAEPAYSITGSRTCIDVYDVSDRTDPVPTREMSVDGSYFSSRMLGDHVYIVVSAMAYEEDGEVELPAMHLGDTEVPIDATDIYYDEDGTADYFYSFTTVTAVNLEKDEREPEYEVFLIGDTGNMFVSFNNIYIASPGRNGNSEETAVHRIGISGDSIVYLASGRVPGRVLNQFSMDEYQGFFRVATTTGQLSGSFDSATSKNHLYVLDMGMDIVGSVENLAPGEEIYSARFAGSRAYIVTFRKVDPLFAIDLSDPYNPEALGQLKITGYSDYLRPYDENHLIGIGKESVAADNGDFAWYQGVKISLFDVSDINNPLEVAKYEIGDRGTDSPVLRDHRALLIDRARNLLVIPVAVAEIDESKYPGGYVPSWVSGNTVWQGAYVFHISPEEGLVYRGRITHIENADDLKGLSYYSPGDSWVQRSLYIDDVLYTISDLKIGMNDLEDLSDIGEIVLP